MSACGVGRVMRPRAVVQGPRRTQIRLLEAINCSRADLVSGHSSREQNRDCHTMRCNVALGCSDPPGLANGEAHPAVSRQLSLCRDQ